MQSLGIEFIQPLKEAVGKSRLRHNVMFQEQGSHHRHISERQQQRTDNTEHQCLSHRSEIFALDTGQRQ